MRTSRIENYCDGSKDLNDVFLSTDNLRGSVSLDEYLISKTGYELRDQDLPLVRRSDVEKRHYHKNTGSISSYKGKHDSEC